MIYQIYQAQTDLLWPLRQMARFGAELTHQTTRALPHPSLLRQLGAGWSLFAESGLRHIRPPFGIESVETGGRRVGVAERAIDETPFGTLLHFRKDHRVAQPRVLLVAPMSGHFATLLRDTVATMLPEHDVFVTDWKNARDIPPGAGRFGLDEFVGHVMRFLHAIGPGGHVVAVCQPAVPVLAAVALMAEAGDPALPRSMTLMAGPIDTRVNPTQVNRLAQSRPIAWFERRLIDRVPWRFRGAGRRVYPGFVQLAAFVGMNFDRHVAAQLSQFRNLVGGESTKTEAHRRFYGEYGAVMDLPAEFYLETVQRVFQQHALAQGRLTWQGRPVNPAAIRGVGLLTVEGERDDICAIGQTVAALALCSGIPAALKRHHLQAGVGHYGVFAGRRWAQDVYPRVRQMIRAQD